MSLTEIFFLVDLINRPALHPLQHLAKSLDQIEQAHRQPGILVSAANCFHLRIRPDVLLDNALLLQHLGRIFEALVFQQPLHQFFARIFLPSPSF